VFRITVPLMAVVFSLTATAATDKRGSEDHPLLERFPRAWIVNYEAEAAPDYRWALGALEKVNSVVSAEKEQRLEGELTRISYRLPAGSTPQEAMAFMEAQLNSKGAERQFSCQGRACGSSNQWANQVFGYSKLYGVERSQSYAAWALNNQSISLYAVQRGNKRVYLHLDVLAQAAPDLVQQLQAQGYVRWPDNGGSEALVDYVAASSAEFWLVGHQQRNGAADQLQQSSYALAETVAQRLRQQGVADERLEVFGAGALAPGLISAGEEAVFLIQRP